MQTINKLLDTALKACNEPSDRQLAKHLDVSPSAISLWRKGKPIKDDHLMALIHLAQADPAIAVLVRTEGAESPEAKKAWSVVWDRLSPVTTVIGAMVLAVTLTPATVKAKAFEINYLNDSSAYSLYIMSNIVRASL
ncbi:hypothetical protein XAC2911_370030 [Xanthomonas citri pv. citri]|nr:hypothetical protein XAC2911_370030 [Xanthomonas citri pv. citri]